MLMESKTTDSFKKLKSYFESRRKLVEKSLEKYLLKTSEPPKEIHESMRYSVLAGGKRLRPILVIAASETCGGKAEWVMPTACAAEMIHTYSLVHDDLPAMDNDSLRRGRPTNHIVYGEAMAILAGDGLLTRAFEIAATNAFVKPVTPLQSIHAVIALAQGAGTQGMVGGQVADVQVDKGRWHQLTNGDRSKSIKILRYIHEHKTAALIVSCLKAGAILAGGALAQISALARYGHCIGLAFQIRDDVLDVVGDKKKLGKSGSDASNQKLTFPAIYGIEESLETAQRLVNDAKRCLALFKEKGQILQALADYILKREN